MLCVYVSEYMRERRPEGDGVQEAQSLEGDLVGSPAGQELRGLMSY